MTGCEWYNSPQVCYGTQTVPGLLGKTDEYLKGNYDGSAEIWRKVVSLNANYNLAFIGIGRSLMREERFAEAMDYFKMAHDRENYGRAYRYQRKIVIERNIGWVVAVLAVLIFVPMAVKKIMKLKREVGAYEHSGLHG